MFPSITKNINIRYQQLHYVKKACKQVKEKGFGEKKKTADLGMPRKGWKQVAGIQCSTILHP